MRTFHMYTASLLGKKLSAYTPIEAESFGAAWHIYAKQVVAKGIKLEEVELSAQ